MIRTLFFDLDDTLLYEESVALGAFDATCELAAQRVGAVDRSTLYTHINQSAGSLWRTVDEPEGWGRMIGISSWEMMWGDFAVGEAPLLRKLREQSPTLRVAAWRNALQLCGVDDEGLARALAEHFRQRLRATIEFLPGALDVLAVLKPRFRLGMITNGAPDVQRHKLEAAELREWFDPIVISGEVGVGKPRRALFEHALRLVNCAPDECVMIGNSFNRDVRGALEAGLHAVWLNLKDAEAPRGNVRFDTIAALNELPAVVARLANGVAS